MWTCPKCTRIFGKIKQVHSCKKIPLSFHFRNKTLAYELFENLVEKINTNIGKCQIVSIPCCVHLFGNYDFLAVLPKKEGLEIRFALNRILDSSRLKQSVPLSGQNFKNCIDIKKSIEIDSQLINWLNEAWHLKDGK